MAVTSVSVKRKPQSAPNTKRVVIDIRGDVACGKTMIAAIVQEALQWHGFQNVEVVSATGQRLISDRLAKPESIRGRLMADTAVQIIDNNEPLRT